MTFISLNGFKLCMELYETDLNYFWLEPRCANVTWELYNDILYNVEFNGAYFKCLCTFKVISFSTRNPDNWIFVSLFSGIINSLAALIFSECFWITYWVSGGKIIILVNSSLTSCCCLLKCNSFLLFHQRIWAKERKRERKRERKGAREGGRC